MSKIEVYDPSGDLPELTMDCVATRCAAGMSAGFFTITPEVALDILTSANTVNRPIRVAKMTQVKRDIESGRFYLNGESIIFGNTGELTDGQHRLRACVEANISIRSAVTFGIPRDTLGTVDQGAARRPGDILAFDGMPSAFVVAAVARNVIAFEAGDGHYLKGLNMMSRTEVTEYVAEHPEIAQSAAWATSKSKYLKGIATASAIGTVHWLLSRRYGVERVEDFLETVIYGENIHRGAPAYAARERLLRLRPRTAPAMIETLLRCWLAHLRGTGMSQVPVTGQFPNLIDEKRRNAFLSRKINTVEMGACA